MAALLACGRDAVLSHRDAAALWGIRKDNRARIEVTTPTHRIGPPSVIVHQARIPPDERTVRDGIPVTSLFRTLLDLARVTREGELRKAMNEAERQGLGDTVTLTSFLKRHANHPGIEKLRSVSPTTRLTRSELEDAFLTYCRSHAIPLPQTNTTVLGYEVDALWDDHALAVELDGYAFHHTRLDIADDNTKAQDLQAHGLTVTRVNDEHLHTPRLARRLRAMMRT
jgi:very-short-patch-repair endonuclease